MTTSLRATVLCLLMSHAVVLAQDFGSLLRSGPIPYLHGPALTLVRGNLTAGDGADITCADYDGDGRRDLIAGSAYGDLVCYRRTDDGFEPPALMLSTNIPRGRGQRQLWQASPELADLDGDGTPDLLLAIGPELFFYRRTAAGMAPGVPLEVAPTQSLGAMIGSSHVAPCAADLDADGDADLALGDEEGRAWWVEHLPGAGLRLAEPRPLMVAGSPVQVGPRARVCAADWDADGHMDLLLGDANGLLWWARGGQGGFMALAPLTQGPLQAPSGETLTDLCPRVGDIDGDAVPEVLLGCRSGFVAVCSRDARGLQFSGYLQARDVPLDVGRYAAPTVTDWDADGMLDIVAGAEDGLLRLYLGRADGRYDGGQVVTANGEPLLAAPGQGRGRFSWPRFADLNGDQVPDLLVGGASGRVEFYLNQGGLRSGGDIRIGGVPIAARGISAFSLADYDGDGDLDLFLGDMALPGSLRNDAASLMPRYVLPAGGVTYYENEAPKGGGLPVFRKGVRVTLYLGSTDRSRDDAALDAAILSPYYVEPLHATDGVWKLLVGTRLGYYLFPSTRTQEYYPAPVLPSPRGRPPAPQFPPMYSCSAVSLGGPGKGLLCGLAEYGFVCYYAPGQVPELARPR
ncbi:MAG: VCBS repeat-containing protein [Armatimonadetes bacterium]|nr:VCBS repeat-containing protein [Armatimonadota bacterium]